MRSRTVPADRGRPRPPAGILVRVEPDLHLDPDAVRRLAASVRRIVDGLPPCPPGYPWSASTRAAAAEMIAFADAAERAVGRVRTADDEAAAGLRRIDEIAVGRTGGPVARHGPR